MNEEQLEFFNLVILPKLKQLAFAGLLSSKRDVLALTFLHFEKTAITFNEANKLKIKAERLGQFASDLDDPLETIKSLLAANPEDDADAHLTMWQPLEGTLSVKQLLELL